MNTIRRIFVEKEQGFNINAIKLLANLKDRLDLPQLESVRVLVRYDIQGVSPEIFKTASTTIFSEPPVDKIFLETLDTDTDENMLAIEFLPGQYDQRADSAAQCIQLLTEKDSPLIKTAMIYLLKGKLSTTDKTSISDYLINPVDSREASIEKPETLSPQITAPQDVKTIEGFTQLTESELDTFIKENGLAMSSADIAHCQKYFISEDRDPTITEIRLLDTYWSDHCRHTTFLTGFDTVEIEDDEMTFPMQRDWEEYIENRTKPTPACLMDLALAAMKELRAKGKLDDLEISREINACSIVVKATVDEKDEDWLIMFKNETHNHPTEIEPFGGAATCLGGAIRDPLSGRSYVYQAMRVTGASDPRVSLKDTLPGKLPQRKITTEAAHGYSSYGNQIGLATGLVDEIYHPGYQAKRMEIGAVVAAAPAENVFRGNPETGDIIILVGGRTGRDGCGGATGSSKKHTKESILTSGAEVQKGNPPTERKIQRLFRNPKVSKMIKVCNDFGAGGISVAIGEIADSLEINLDAVPKKYEGLDGTELAISESQERMAVLVKPEDEKAFIEASKQENLEAVRAAIVTDDMRVKMIWKGKVIVDLSREFIETNGVLQSTDIFVKAPVKTDWFKKITTERIKQKDLSKAWTDLLSNLNICSKKGLVEMFDSTIGAASVFHPFGGKTQRTPQQVMAAKLPVQERETTTGTVMSYGYNPFISEWSPYHGAVYAVLESVSKMVASGIDYRTIRLTFQEYFERLEKDPEKWGQPLSALLGAYRIQKELEIAAIGGKDSMSGTFEKLTVPPTLVSFTVAATDVRSLISSEWKTAGSQLVQLVFNKDSHNLPDYESLRNLYLALNKAILNKEVLSTYEVSYGGLAEALSKAAFGNKLGASLDSKLTKEDLFCPELGSILCEIPVGTDPSLLFKGISFKTVGTTSNEPSFVLGSEKIDLETLYSAWTKPMEKVFPTEAKGYSYNKTETTTYTQRSTKSPRIKTAKPRVIIPTFPGTNCENDSAAAFARAGALPEIHLIRNMTPEDIHQSIVDFADKIKNSQIIMIPGGFSAGDEPEGSGKFIAAVFRNPRVTEAVQDLLENRDGLILGICNGFQALVKLGLLPYGKITDLTKEAPTLTFNTIGRHISSMATTQITSTLSPWFAGVETGDRHIIPISHGEGRFAASEPLLKELFLNGQVASQYVTPEGKMTDSPLGNPNGSSLSIEGITSKDGRILGKMGHSERIGLNVSKNIYGKKDQKIFESGVSYFR